MELVHIEIRDILKKKIEKIFERKFENIDVQYSTKKEFGDFQTNFSLINSEIIGKKPREIGKMIIKSLENDKKNDIIDKIEIAGPGFLNIFLKNSKSPFISQGILLSFPITLLFEYATTIDIILYSLP